MAAAKRYSCLDLFAGAGGLTLGLEAAGFESLGAVEIDPIAAESFRLNFGDRIVDFFGPSNGDMERISATKLRERLDQAGVGELDLLAAAPPCQGFSRVGRGKLDSMASRPGAFLKDKRNSLFREAVLVVRELRPRVFLFENVPGMLHLRGQNVAEAVCEGIAELGYIVRAALLNSAWYGVPQTRERIFVLAIRSDLGVAPSFPERRYQVDLTRGHLSKAELDPGNWNNPEFFMTAEELSTSERQDLATTARMALDDLPPFKEHLKAASNGHRYRARRDALGSRPYRKPPENWYASLMRRWNDSFVSEEVTDHFCRWTPRDFGTFQRMRAGDKYPQAVEIAQGRYHDAIERWRENGGRRPRRSDFIPPYSLENFPDKWRKLIPAYPAWTVTAHLAKDTYSHIHYDSMQARGISIREAARLQSFPDAFCLAGNMGDAFRQLGNAVPPLLGRAIGLEVVEILRDADGTGRSRPGVPGGKGGGKARDENRG